MGSRNIATDNRLDSGVARPWPSRLPPPDHSRLSTERPAIREVVLTVMRIPLDLDSPYTMLSTMPKSAVERRSYPQISSDLTDGSVQNMIRFYVPCTGTDQDSIASICASG